MFDTADCFSILLLEPSEHKPEDNPYPRGLSAPVQEESPLAAGKRSPSPAKNPRCKTLHVKNLVRPFTQNQLKDLLGKHGTLVENGFWIDRIKSHCYVVYTDEDDAVATRQALHGIKWPATSPKILDVDYADEDEMARDTEGFLGRKKEKEREANAEKDEIKEPSVEEEKPMETEEKEEEEEEDQKNAGNLLDNLFKKTKTIPCLYWLPLTDEQIATREREREERRKARQEERDKEEQERKERQQQREKERELEREKEKRERDTAEKQRSRSPRNRRRERSKSRSRSRGPRRR